MIVVWQCGNLRPRRRPERVRKEGRERAARYAIPRVRWIEVSHNLEDPLLDIVDNLCMQR